MLSAFSFFYEANLDLSSRRLSNKELPVINRFALEVCIVRNRLGFPSPDGPRF